MLFKLHYWLITSGCCSLNILMGVFMKTYTDASAWEVGMLFMMMPFVSFIAKPMICSMADRHQAHRRYMMICLTGIAIGYAPFIVIPMIGPRLYQDHARVCWYVLVALKVVSDGAFVSAWTLGDSLAINYAKRTGYEFSVFRVWGTISWMVFGVIIGLINEVSFLPKYVPAFMILIISSLLNMFIIWLWPSEYFRIVIISKEETDARSKKPSPLMPKEKVWAIMKWKLMSAFGWCCCWSIQESLNDINANIGEKSNQNNEVNEKINTKETNLQIAVKLTLDKRENHQLEMTSNNEKDKTINNMICFEELNEKLEVENLNNKKTDIEQLENPALKMTPSTKQQQQLPLDPGPETDTDEPISKRVQFRILCLLVMRRPSLIGYIMMFICCGFASSAINFLFLDLENICNTQGTCEFSKIAGGVQFSMAFFETFLFIYIKKIKQWFTYSDMIPLIFLFNTIKWMFYGLFWRNVNPHFSVIVESLHGLSFGLYLTLVIEIAHIFSSQVVEVLPELYKRNYVPSNVDQEKLKLSLVATMQAIMSNANDGLGRGVGALIMGILLEIYSFDTVWLLLGLKSLIILVITLIINLHGRYRARTGTR